MARTLFTQEFVVIPRDTKRDHVNFVRIGYNDACTDFVVRFHHYDFDQLEKAIKNVGDYNEFNGAAIAKAFAKIKHLVYSVEFGREGSPVLYLHLKRDYTEGVTTPGTGDPIGVEEVMKAFKGMRKHSPDEAFADQYDAGSLRFWWD